MRNRIARLDWRVVLTLVSLAAFALSGTAGDPFPY